VTPDEAQYIAERSKDPTRTYCPECRPDIDPLTGLWNVCYCGEHLPAELGTADALARVPDVPASPNEAGGNENRLWCNFFHRKELPFQ
jgi:hypothetical protein